MYTLRSFRLRSALIGFATALFVCGGQALPAAASSELPKTFTFHLSSNQDVTTFLPACPAGTPSPYTFRCGYGINEPIAQDSADAVRLSTTPITESFVSALAAPALDTRTGLLSIADFSAVSLHTSRGDIYIVTHDGSFCITTNSDVEPFYIVGGTGTFKGATGFGTVYAYQNAAPTLTQGFAAETYTATITLAR